MKIKALTKLFSYLLVFALLFQDANSQNIPSSLDLTLQKAKELSKQNNPLLLARDVDVQAAREAIHEARLKKLPEVFGDFNLQKNLIIPTTPVPANAFNPGAPEGEILPLKFTTKHSGNTGINASYDVFNPVKNRQIKRKSFVLK